MRTSSLRLRVAIIVIALAAGIGAASLVFSREGDTYECSDEDGTYIAVAQLNPLTGSLRGYRGEDHNGLSFTIDGSNSSEFDCIEEAKAERLRLRAREECLAQRVANPHRDYSWSPDC